MTDTFFDEDFYYKDEFNRETTMNVDSGLMEQNRMLEIEKNLFGENEEHGASPFRNDIPTSQELQKLPSFEQQVSFSNQESTTDFRQ